MFTRLDRIPPAWLDYVSGMARSISPAAGPIIVARRTTAFDRCYTGHCHFKKFPAIPIILGSIVVATDQIDCWNGEVPTGVIAEPALWVSDHPNFREATATLQEILVWLNEHDYRSIPRTVEEPDSRKGIAGLQGILEPGEIQALINYRSFEPL